MVPNLRIERSLRNVFSTSTDSDVYSLRDNLCLDSNSVFRKSIVVEVNNDEIEVPVIAKNQFEFLIYERFTNSSIIGTKKIILPLYNNSEDLKKKTFDSIITQLFRYVEYGKRLQKIITSKGDIYYGGKGIILDRDFTPLLLCTLIAKSVSIDNKKNMVYYRPICHISPKVFVESSKLINKGIINKIIPYYTNTDMTLPSPNYIFKSKAENNKVKVIVDNFDNFFIEPIKPTPSAIAEDALNECLIDNIEDIMMLI